MSGSRAGELGVEVVEQGSSDVDYEVGLGISEQFFVGMCDARLVSHGQHRIEDAGAGVEYLRHILRPRTEVCELGMAGAELLEERDHRVASVVVGTRVFADGDEVAVEQRVNPVDGAGWTGGLDEVFCVRERLKHRPARDPWRGSGDERCGVEAFDESEHLGVGTLARVRPCVWWEPLDDAPQHLRLVLGRERCEDGDEGLSGRPLMASEAKVEVAVVRVELGVRTVGKAVGNAEVTTVYTDVAIDDSADLRVREATSHSSASPSRSVSTNQVGQPHPRQLSSPARARQGTKPVGDATV